MKLNTATLALSLSLSSLVSAGLSSSGGLALGGVHRHKARSLDVSSAASLTRRQSNANGSGGGGDNGGGGGGGGNNQGGGNAAAEDPQTSLTLDPSQVQPGLALDGQQVPAANQVASATSVNNFINFCLTRADLPLTNGAQVKTGSCNNVPMGVIGAQAKAPTSKFINPPNFATIQSNTDFTVQMAINNLVTGNFVNAQSNYFAAPQNTDNNGIIIGHSHVVIEQIDKLDSTTVTNSQNFAFFKGFNEAAVNGILSADVTGGLPAGVYKMSSINSASNHQPVLIGVAQHGSLDDAVYFTVSDNAAGADQNGAAAGGNGAAAGGGAQASGSASAVSDSNLAPASTTPNISAGQTSLSSVASSTSAASASASATSASVEGGTTATTTTAAAAASTTAAGGGGGGGRRGGRRFGGGRRGRNGRGFTVKERAAPPAPTSTLASLLKKRLAAMGEEFDGVVLA